MSSVLLDSARFPALTMTSLNDDETLGVSKKERHLSYSPSLEESELTPDNAGVGTVHRSFLFSIISVFSTVVCTVLGGGMLAQPSVLMESGWVLGSLLIVGFATAACCK